MLIKSSRSHIETYEKCPRKRFWQYEYDGTGLEPSDERGLKLDARMGQGVHDGIEFALEKGQSDDMRTRGALAAGFGVDRFMQDIADAGINTKDLPEQQQTEVHECFNIVTALVYAWVRVRLPQLLKEGDILAVEKEIDVDYVLGDDTVRIMTRPDIIWRRRSDGSVFIRNLKTVRDPKTTWREQWALDMQTLTEPLAVDKWLLDTYSDHETIVPTCSGVIIDGLVTGSVLDYPRGSGKFYHNTPLLWAWVKRGDAPFGEDEWYPRYEWSCFAPHKMGNGRKCPGDRTHKLAGAIKKNVAADYPGGVLAWIDHLLEEEEAVVQDQIIELPPIMRAPYAIERWKRMTLMREVFIHKYAHIISLTNDTSGPAIDEKFPMHTASGNCLRPGKCAFYDLCHGTAAADPYAANYRARTPHHKQEESDG